MYANAQNKEPLVFQCCTVVFANALPIDPRVLLVFKSFGVLAMCLQVFSRCCRMSFGVSLEFVPDGWGGGVGIRTSFILHAYPKHWYLQRFHLFVQHTAQGCGRRKSVNSLSPNLSCTLKPSFTTPTTASPKKASSHSSLSPNLNSTP